MRVSGRPCSSCARTAQGSRTTRACSLMTTRSRSRRGGNGSSRCRWCASRCLRPHGYTTCRYTRCVPVAYDSCSTVPAFSCRCSPVLLLGIVSSFSWECFSSAVLCSARAIVRVVDGGVLARYVCAPGVLDDHRRRHPYGPGCRRASEEGLQPVSHDRGGVVEACVLVRYQHLDSTRIFSDSLTIGPAGCSLHLTGPPASHSGGLVRSRTKSEMSAAFSCEWRTDAGWMQLRH